uniref:A-kinase anchor protein 9-like n=1 Tax=Styela clava TaxID=7725 RepID=UPI00193A920E|nr:A-kinase anchor protein 9-like [Styela clava]
MDDEERKRKLEAGKAKLASFQKKRRTGKSPRVKRRKDKDTSATDEALKSAGAGDSIAVQTGSDNTEHRLTLSEDSDVSTTADEISTEEEASYAGGLSPRERIQELELTVSDQQIALQKLTLENKQLRDKEGELEETLLARDSVIGELRKNVSETASHVKQLQENLSSATESVRASDGDQSEIVSQLVEARKDLKTYVDAIHGQEEAMKQMASKLEQKSIEAEEAHELCRSLKVELDKTRPTQTYSIDDTQSDAIQALRSELEEQHGHQIALLKKELDKAREEITELQEREHYSLFNSCIVIIIVYNNLKIQFYVLLDFYFRFIVNIILLTFLICANWIKERRLLEDNDLSSSTMDESDIRAFKEQLSQLSLQLEGSFRELDRQKRDHDIEVVKLNQRLIGTIDEYEAKIQAEKENVAELENRLDMSDTVSSEIQSSFSKQLQQLEEERDELKSQLREAQSAARENANSAKLIEDLEDQLTTYKAEVEETEKRLEERNKQSRKQQDELDRRKDEIHKQEKETKRLVAEITNMKEEISEVKDKVREQEEEYNILIQKHASDIESLEEQHRRNIEEVLQDSSQQADEDILIAKDEVRKEMEEKIQEIKDDHSNELKAVQNQNHSQMDEFKKEMENKLQAVKDTLEQEKKSQMGTVKDVHERTREREFDQIKQAHEEEIARMQQDHETAIESLNQEHGKVLKQFKERFNEEKILEGNRIRREMEEDFASKMQQLHEENEQQKEKDIDSIKLDLQEKHAEEINQLEKIHSSRTKESEDDVLLKQNEMWETKIREQAEEHKEALENLTKEHEQSRNLLQEEHQSKLTELENEHKTRLEAREEEMKKLLQEQREEQESAIQLIKDEGFAREQNEKQVAEQMEALQLQLTEATVKLEEEYSEKLSALESEHKDEKLKLEEECHRLKETVNEINKEREEIINQAEESRKRLESLHHEEMLELREQLETHVHEHKEKLKRMQVEMESSRTSRSQLQELKEELVARNATVEQVELLKSEFNEKEKVLLSQHEQLVENLKEEHEAELSSMRNQLEANLPSASGDYEQYRSDLEKELIEYKEKLAAAQANLASISASSPMRPMSSASDYDPANISAMKKDIRNALTITHISDVSGIGDELEEGVLHMTTEDEEMLEEGELPTLEEGDLIESKESQVTEQEKDEDESSSSSSSSSDEDSVHEEKEEVVAQLQDSQQLSESVDIGNEIEILTSKVEELQNELLQMTDSHKSEMQELMQNYETQLQNKDTEFEESKNQALKEIEDQYIAEKEDLLQTHANEIKTSQEQHENEIMQLRLKCASETASQVDDELNKLRNELENFHKNEIESLKLAMETQMNEKIQEKDGEKEDALSKLSEEHSSSMQEKISVLMSELYEQKQESLQKLSDQHQDELKKIQNENDKLTEERTENHQKEIERLNADIQNAKQEYQKLLGSLEDGDNDHIKMIEDQHKNEIEKIKKLLAEENEIKLRKQAEEFEQSQSEYVKQHQQQIDKFVNEREEDIRRVEEAKQKELDELDHKYKEEIKNLQLKLEEGKLSEQSEIEDKFEEEKNKLKEEFNEELKVVATKLVEIKEERDELLSLRDQLQSQLQHIESEHEQAQAELKAALIAHHMEKFQAAITELDQHHLEEMEKLRQDHEKETDQYKKVAEDLIQKMKDLEEEYKSSISSLKEDKESSVQNLEMEYREKLEEEKIEHGSAITSMREAHEAQMLAIQEEHDAQLRLIEEEVATQNMNHKEALNNILQSQAIKLGELQQQFDVALNATKAEGQQQVELLEGKVKELENRLEKATNLQEDLKAAKSETENIEAEASLQQNISENLEAYEIQLKELTKELDKSKEEIDSMNSKIEFERAEYESEIDQLQDELRNKEDNVKELESELSKNKNAIEKMNEKFETITSRRDREGKEEDNLIHMLRDDLDRINEERDQLSNANQQLLSTITELVQANHKCEDIITKRLQSLPGDRSRDSTKLSRSDLKSKDVTERKEESSSSSESDPSTTPSSPKLEVSTGTGSFVDEGLDLSQRLAESMFAGPELDTSARDVAVGSGTRLTQAVEKLIDALQPNIEQLNGTQQAQLLLGEDFDQDKKSQKKKKEVEDDESDDDSSSKTSESGDARNVETVLADYMNQQIDLENRIQEQEKETENLKSELDNLRTQNHKLQEELNLLQKQKEAFMKEGDEAELSLIKLTEELGAEKQAISDQYEASRIHFEKQAQQLEAVFETETKKMEEKENELKMEVDDLTTQIEALQKHVSSNSKFSAEQTNEREIEREQFQQEIDNLQEELNKKHDLHRSDSKLTEEVSRLEEEMEARELAHQEQISKMQEEEEKMKKTIQEYEENLQELRGGSEQSEIDVVKAQLQDMTAEREVIQQELYDNLLKVSALEAKLDQYKHNGDMPGGGAGDQSQVERLRMNLDQEREAHESKDNEIEHLVGVHAQLRAEIIEKEDEVERLLHEIETYKELEAENIKLKEELRVKEAAESSAVEPSRAEELEALSRQLLDEKNAEIDELENKVKMLEIKAEKDDDSSSESSSDDEKEDDSMQKLKEENLHLRSKLDESEKKLETKESSEKMEDEVLQQKMDPDKDVEESHPAMEEELEQLKQENEKLKNEVQEMKKVTESNVSLLGVSPETKEKIHHLEELLMEEKPETQEEKGTSESESSLVESVSDGKPKHSEIIQEKLHELENELKSQPNSILGRILAEKDDKIQKQDSKIKKAEDEMSEQKDNVTKLQDKISNLEENSLKPDVKVRMKSKGKTSKGKEGEQKDIDIEKDSRSSAASSSDEDSSVSSLDQETSITDQDVHDAPQEKVQVESDDKSPEELKILVDQQEKDLIHKDELLENHTKLLADKQQECSDLLDTIAVMEKTCKELQDEIEQRVSESQSEPGISSLAEMTEEDILNLPAVQEALNKATEDLEKALKTTEHEIASSKEEKERLVSELGDVQREYMALLNESKDVQMMQENQNVLQDKIKDLEGLVAERESELQQAQQEYDELQKQTHQLMQDVEILKQQDPDTDKDGKIEELEQTLQRKLSEYNRLLQELQQKEETVETLEQQIENSNQQSKAHEDEIELLQNEQQILNSENEKVQQETEQLKAKVEELENMVSEKEKEIENKEKELDTIKKERFIEPQSAMLFEEGSLEEEDASNSSSSSDEEELKQVDSSLSIEEMTKTHEAEMESLKNKYSQALTRVVEETRKQLEEEHEKQMSEMQNKHKKEITGILSESFNGESELAKKLREELDLADQLDQNLMGHLASGGVDDNEDDDVDISTKLQVKSNIKGLLDRIHNEGVQVLSLSELQFLKYHQQHQPTTRTSSTTPPPIPATVEEAQQTSMRLEEDMNQLRKSWENEKLALLNAIQALKELCMQTNADNSNEPLPETEDPRGDLIHAVSDVFEKERDALIAELQTSVLEAQQQNARKSPGFDEQEINVAKEKLQELEERIKQQGEQHTDAIQRLLTVERDSLINEIKDLRNDRKQNLKQAEERIHHLESQLSNNGNSNSQNVQMLQSQIERLEYKLQQERALAADVRSSLEAERVRATDHLPALQRERDRSVELDNEIGRLQRKLAEDAEATRARTEALQVELDDNRGHLEDLQNKLSEAREKLTEAEEEAGQVKHDHDKNRSQDARTIQDLKHALIAEENKRGNLAKSLEAERNNVAQLHEELATLRADSHQEIETGKIRLADMEDTVVAEKRKCDDLNAALQREQETSERLRGTIEEERSLANEGRQHDRDTVNDLQRILDDAKTETEKLQRKIDISEREARVAKQQLEDAQAIHHDAIEAERAVRDQLQSALDNIQEQKQDALMKLHNMEDQMRRQNLENLITNAGVPASSTTNDGLMANRRQLESLRQRLQMESTKLQDLMSKTAQRLPVTLPTDSFNQPDEAARELASEIEQVDSVKRSLAEMQQELREMYSTLSVPQREKSGILSDSSPFNDRLMDQNAELVMLNTKHTDEKIALRDALRRLEEEVWKARVSSEDNSRNADDTKQHQQQVQEMASRMHRLYVRYLRAESFRKALVYQKKYLLLLIGGFQECEEATLALVARMGAYPNDDSDHRPSHRSTAFKRFRSAARVIMAVSRLKFLVRKWSRTSSSISASIQEKHGTGPITNGHHAPHSSSHRRPSRSTSPHHLRPMSSTSAHTLGEKSPSPTPLPRYRGESYDTHVPSYEPYRQTLRAAAQHMDTTPTKLSESPLSPVGAYGASSSSGARPRNAYTRSTTSPYLNSYGDQPSATALRYLNGSGRPGTRPRPRSYHTDYRTPDLSAMSYSRTQPGESDPSLNEYIQKLENLHHRLEQNPHRYQR